MSKLWTIGHGLAKPELIRVLLEAERIDVVIDVRSKPWSQRNPSFNRARLKTAVESWDMEYLWLGENLGGLDQHTAQHLAEACDQVAALARQKRVVLLCSESHWQNCHRDYLLAGEFQARGLTVVHLLHDRTAVKAPTLAHRISTADQDRLF